MSRVVSNGAKERIEQLCSEFKLPTVGAEAASRFAAAGHADALVTLVEVLEAGSRRSPTAAHHPAQTSVQAARR